MKIGDKVRFLNETGGGVITGFPDKDIVTVLTEDDFEFPVLRKEVIVVSATHEDFEKPGEDPEISSSPDEEKEFNPEPVEIKVADFLEIKDHEKGAERRTRPDSTVEEIDLHIESIIDDYKNLSNGEILEMQLARFTTALDGAMRSKQQKIIFIHGKGAGKLKYEMQKKLKEEYPRLRFQDASFKEYGYGAMLVLIR